MEALKLLPELISKTLSFPLSLSPLEKVQKPSPAFKIKVKEAIEESLSSQLDCLYFCLPQSVAVKNKTCTVCYLPVHISGYDSDPCAVHRGFPGKDSPTPSSISSIFHS